MTLPTNWDSSTVTVDPYGLNSAAEAVQTSTTNIYNYLTDINNSLGGLQLSWIGESASVADEFNTRWVDAMTALYGPSTDPGKGIMNVLNDGLKMAVQNYSNSESSVAKMFNQFNQGSPSSSNNEPTGNFIDDWYPTRVTSPNYHTTSVDEKFGSY